MTTDELLKEMATYPIYGQILGTPSLAFRALFNELCKRALLSDTLAPSDPRDPEEAALRVDWRRCPKCQNLWPAVSISSFLTCMDCRRREAVLKEREECARVVETTPTHTDWVYQGPGEGEVKEESIEGTRADIAQAIRHRG